MINRYDRSHPYPPRRIPIDPSLSDAEPQAEPCNPSGEGHEGKTESGHTPCGQEPGKTE